MASIRKRNWTHKGVSKTAWILTYTDNGGKRRQKTFERKKDADNARLTIESEVGRGLHVADRDTLKLSNICEMYLDNCEVRRRMGQMAGGTIKAYRTDLRQICKEFGNLKATDVSSDMIQEYINEAIIKGKMPRTVRGRVSTLGCVLNFASKKRLVPMNVIREHPCVLPRVEKRTKVPTKDDLSRLLLSLQQRPARRCRATFQHHRCFVALGLFCGLRPGEIRGLQWSDVNETTMMIKVKHSQSDIDGLKAPKTEAGFRKVPMVQPVMDALKGLAIYRDAKSVAFIQEGKAKSRLAINARAGRLADNWQDSVTLSGRTGYVIYTQTGKPFSTSDVALMWKEIMDRAGLVCENGKALFTLHALRHAAASLMIERGLPTLNLTEFMGHSSVQTTYDVYGHLFEGDSKTQDAALNITQELAPNGWRLRQVSDIDPQLIDIK